MCETGQDETRRDETRRLITLVFRLPAISESHPGRPFFRASRDGLLGSSANEGTLEGPGWRFGRGDGKFTSDRLDEDDKSDKSDKNDR